MVASLERNLPSAAQMAKIVPKEINAPKNQEPLPAPFSYAGKQLDSSEFASKASTINDSRAEQIYNHPYIMGGYGFNPQNIQQAVIKDKTQTGKMFSAQNAGLEFNNPAESLASVLKMLGTLKDVGANRFNSILQLLETITELGTQSLMENLSNISDFLSKMENIKELVSRDIQLPQDHRSLQDLPGRLAQYVQEVVKSYGELIADIYSVSFKIDSVLLEQAIRGIAE
jgi:hypothetical protein